METLYDVLDKLCKVPERPVSAPMRMPISGIYKIKGVGDVLAGDYENNLAGAEFVSSVFLLLLCVLVYKSRSVITGAASAAANRCRSFVADRAAATATSIILLFFGISSIFSDMAAMWIATLLAISFDAKFFMHCILGNEKHKDDWDQGQACERCPRLRIQA